MSACSAGQRVGTTGRHPPAPPRAIGDAADTTSALRPKRGPIDNRGSDRIGVILRDEGVRRVVASADPVASDDAPMSVPAALLEPDLRRYPLRAVRLQGAGGVYRFVAPRSAADLLRRSDARVARAVRGEHPYWAEIWPASIALFRRLLRGPDLTGTRVVDLGCGVGVAGVGAALRGATVTFVDREPEALAFAAFHARQHGAVGFEVRELDWEVDALPDRTDLLLLADLGYQYRAVRALLRQVDAVLARGGRVLCGDPERPTANDLFAGLVARGATLERSTAEDPSAGGRVTVRIAAVGEGPR